MVDIWCITFSLVKLHPYLNIFFLFCGAVLQSGPNEPVVEVSRSHTHTHSRAPLSDQPLAEVSNYTTHNTQKRRKCMVSAGFDPTIPIIKRA